MIPVVKKLCIILAFSGLLVACAEPARLAQMTVMHDQLSKPAPKMLKRNISVGEVSGGKQTSPAWKSEVDNESLKQALTDSLKFAGLHARENQADYIIRVTLNELKQPIFSTTYEVISNISYQITGRQQTETFLVEGTGVATMKEALLGVERLKLANERSIQDSIRQFMELLIERFQ